MTSHSLRFALLVTLGACALSGAAALTACSSSDSGAGGSGDAGQDATTKDAGGKSDSGGDTDSGADGGLTQKQCEDKCFADHPSGAKKFDAIDTCWAASCKAPCVDETGSFDGGPDAAPPQADGGVCNTSITSGVDKACDDCTNAFCCAEWAGCFTDTDCNALNDCLGDCQP
jgi:hypothetical protein